MVLEKARFEITFDIKATELTLNPFTWQAFEEQLKRMDLEGIKDPLRVEKIQVIGGKTVTYLEGLLVCLDPEFPLMQILVS